MGTPQLLAIATTTSLANRAEMLYDAAPKKAGKPYITTFYLRRHLRDVDPGELAVLLAAHTAYYHERGRHAVRAARKDIERVDEKLAIIQSHGGYGLYWRRQDAKRLQGQRTRRELLKAMKSGPKSLEELAQVVGLTTRGTREALHKLRDKGRVQHVRRGRSHFWERSAQYGTTDQNRTIPYTTTTEALVS